MKIAKVQKLHAIIKYKWYKYLNIKFLQSSYKLLRNLFIIIK